jgi:RNA polymerase subunit RPABC4/transcription elongation factor Spt4
MDRTLADILGKPSDFKVCKKCGRINWYENEKCIGCNSKKFDKNTEVVIEAVEKEYDYWINIEKYTEEEANDVVVEV